MLGEIKKAPIFWSNALSYFSYFQLCCHSTPNLSMHRNSCFFQLTFLCLLLQTFVFFLTLISPLSLFKKPVSTNVYGLYSYYCIAPRVGLEPTTTRLTAECSTIELSRIIFSWVQVTISEILHSIPLLIYTMHFLTGLLLPCPQNRTLNCFSLFSTSASLTFLTLHPFPFNAFPFLG